MKSNYSETERKVADRALTLVAHKNKVSREDVDLAIQALIERAFANSREDERSFWYCIPHEGDLPTPLELVMWLLRTYPLN